MTVAINTKFNFGDEVYLVIPGLDYYVEKTPYKVVGFNADVSSDYTKVRCFIEQNGNISSTIEDFLFSSYEEAEAWSEERQLTHAGKGFVLMKKYLQFQTRRGKPNQFLF